MRDAVEHVRAAGIDVEVVSPADFRHFGIAYGHGIVGNLRRRPWLVLALPLFLAGFVRAARRASRDADLVHAHWLPSGLVAALAGKPFLVQLWGTDVELARRAPWLARPILRRGRGRGRRVGRARRRGSGARRARGRADPGRRGASGRSRSPPAEPPHVLFVGRLSPEKGIEDFLEATEGLPRAIVGSGPVAVPEAIGFVPPAQVGAYYERAAVVCVPSRREGVGMTAREAMAYGRPVVATAVGGLPDAIRDGETGLLVPPGDPTALREAIQRLLADADLRERLGIAARAHAEANLSWSAATAAVVSLYEQTVRR